MDEVEFENKLTFLIEKQKLFQWENYALGKNNCLNVIDQKIYNLIDNINPENIFSNQRKKEIFIGLYNKLIVENDPNISKLKNKLDEKDDYIIRSDKEDTNYKSILAKKMSKDVINLINLRNKKAVNLGFLSYPDLIFSYEELDKNNVANLIRDYLENNIDKANYLISEYNLTWQNWFKKLRNLGKIHTNDPAFYVNCLLNKLNFRLTYNDLQFKFDKDGISGMTFCISSPNDIRVLLKPITSPMTVRVLFHECGHAVNYSIINEKGIYNLYTTFFDELIAIIFENIGIGICMKQFERNIAEDVKFLETIRCSISFLFEMDLWEAPNHAEKLYEKYQSILRIKPKEKEMWALDSFRFIDPVYIQNYVLGEIYAKKIIKHLKLYYNSNYNVWGKALKESFIKNGMKLSFEEKFNNIRE